MPVRKNIFLLAITGLFPFQLFAAQISSVDSELSHAALTIESESVDASCLAFNLNATELVRSTDASGVHTRFYIEGEPVTPTPGWPELPAITKLYLIPPTGGVDFRINELQYRTEVVDNVFIVPEQGGSANLDVSGQPIRSGLCH